MAAQYREPVAVSYGSWRRWPVTALAKFGQLVPEPAQPRRSKCSTLEFQPISTTKQPKFAAATSLLIPIPSTPTHLTVANRLQPRPGPAARPILLLAATEPSHCSHAYFSARADRRRHHKRHCYQEERQEQKEGVELREAKSDRFQSNSAQL